VRGIRKSVYRSMNMFIAFPLHANSSMPTMELSKTRMFRSLPASKMAGTAKVNSTITEIRILVSSTYASRRDGCSMAGIADEPAVSELGGIEVSFMGSRNLLAHASRMVIA